MSMPADWAIEMAMKEGAVPLSKKHVLPDLLIALARRIERTEQPPRDPLWEYAAELVISEDIARTSSQIAAIREGRAGKEKVELVLRALRRGMALREEAGQ